MSTKDNYKLLQNGEIKLTEKTNDKTDKLYATDKKGNVDTKKSITVAKGVLDKGLSGTLKTRFGDVNYTSYSTGMQGNELFKFAAENSNVEWSLVKVSDGRSFVSTSNSKTSEAGGVGVVNHLLMGLGHPVEWDHSHPMGIHYPSGRVPAGSDFPESADIAVSRWISKKFFGSTFNIFTPVDGQSTPYNYNTKLPPLPEVIVRPGNN